MKSRIACLVACACLATSACQVLMPKPGVVIASDPPGARVLVDGRDSGFVTPCNLDLEQEDDERIKLDLVLPGYRVARIDMLPDERSYSMRYIDMYADYSTWCFPLWLNFDDFLFPFKKESWSSPARIHVPMRLSID